MRYTMPTFVSGRRHEACRLESGTRHAMGALVSGRRHTVSMGAYPESSGPPPVTYAPDFPGVLRMQLRPKDLLLGGASLGDPIGTLPCLGGLVAGDFTASGTARPLLVDDGTGRIAAQFDGVDDVLRISAAIAAASGYTFIQVTRRDVYGVPGGAFRIDAGSRSEAGKFAQFSNSAGGNYVFEQSPLNFFESVGGTSTANALESAGVIFGAGAQKGIYKDKTNIRPTSYNATYGFTGGTRISMGDGYGGNYYDGYIYDQIFYNAVLTLDQYYEVADYLRNEWNGGSAF